MNESSTWKDLLRKRLLSGRLLWLFLVTAAVSLAVLVGVLHYGRGQILQQAEQSAGHLAWMIESRLSSTFQRIEADMRHLAHALNAPVQGSVGAARERARVEALLADHVTDFPGVLRITVFDADGALLYSSNRAMNRTVNIADTPPFRQLRANPGLGTLYSEVVTARADARSTVVVMRALVAPDGRFIGQMNTLLDLGHFQSLIDSVDIGTHGVVFIRRSDDNRLVLRRPELPAEINRTLDSPAWRPVKGGEASGTARVISPIDKVMRVQSFRALQDQPFYVAVALANGDILAGWRQQTLVVSSLTVLSLAVFGLLMRTLHRTERRRDAALQALTRSEHDLRVAATAFASQEAMVITDERFDVLRVNDAFTRVTGFSAREVMGRNAWAWRSLEPDDASDAIQVEALSDVGFWAGEIGGRRKSGENFVASVTISAVSDDAGRVTHYVAGFTDISERKAAEQSIHTLAFYDPLTHLPNRRLLMERLHHAMVVSERNRAQCALVFLDLDHFKLINDTRGHAMGDALLVAVAERLRHCVRASDTVARQGGDEFVVMLESLDNEVAAAAAQAGDVAEKIRIALADPFVLDGSDYHGSASLGVCLFCGNDFDANELFKRCDTAMYQAKQTGRNALRFFDPTMQLALERRAALDADLRQAIVLRQLELHYQLQVDGEGRALGAEALLRWRHPQRGLVPPLDFIPVAEETGVILGIGQWVLETGCDLLAAWAADPLTRDLRLAVNVSARQFRQVDFVDGLRASLLRSGARPTYLELELTESLVMEDVADTIAKMEALRALGVAFSIDDFGTGYSSLAYLQRLPLDSLKIDRSFILGVTSDEQSAAIVRSIITLAKALDLNVIAEGVETELQRDVLLALGCEGFQGYLFARPLPRAAFIDLLEALRQENVRALSEVGVTDTSDQGEDLRRVPRLAAGPVARHAQNAVAD